MIDPTELHAYADGEATPEERLRVEEALRSSDRDAAELQGIHALKECVLTHATPIDNEEGWKSCVQRLDEIDKSKRIEGFVSRYAWGLCAVFFFIILGGGMITRNSRSTVRTGEVARYVSSMSGFPDLGRPEVSEVKRWLGQEAPAVENTIQPERMQIMGRASAIIDNRRVVKLNLLDARGPLALVIVENAQAVEGVERMGGQGSYGQGSIDQLNCVTWSLNGCSLILIGDRSHDQLRDIASMIRIR